MFDAKKDTVIVIPSYEPTEEFFEYAEAVAAAVHTVLVVNDGSGEAYEGLFARIAAIPRVQYISYPENHGKGYALKTAFAYCAEHFGSEQVIVTADCDGQHALSDILRVAHMAHVHPEALVLGSRDFNQPQVPKRSRAGNTNIRRLFRLLYGLDVYDTQTGLRGFSVGLSKLLGTVRGDRFEYEMGVLVHCRRQRIPILEVPIATIYPEDPKDHVSHFKTFRDSARVVGVLLSNLNRYLISSALSAALDVLIFFLISHLLLPEISAINTLIATVSARVGSSVLNYALNRRLVFGGSDRRAVIRYYTLWLLQLGASYGLVFLLGNILGGHLTLMKALGDLLLAIVSYQIQRVWVFAGERKQRFYRPFGRLVRSFLRAFSHRYRANVITPKEGTLYVCRHLDMHGPYTTLKWLPFHVHGMVLSTFFDERECYRQYADYTFTARRGRRAHKFHLRAFVASRVVAPTIRSMGSIPVYRGGVSALRTLRTATDALLRGESVVVYPDVAYTAGAEAGGEIYEGFLMIGQLYRRKAERSLRIVPLYIDESRRSITECLPTAVDDFDRDREAASAHIMAAINGRT